MDSLSASEVEQKNKSFAKQAAKGSWQAAIIVFLLVAFGGRTGAKVIVELAALLLIVVGFILGVVSLFGIPKHGVKGILLNAVLGIVINGLLLLIFSTNFLAARAKARNAAGVPSRVAGCVATSR